MSTDTGMSYQSCSNPPFGGNNFAHITNRPALSSAKKAPLLPASLPSLLLQAIKVRLVSSVSTYETDSAG